MLKGTAAALVALAIPKFLEKGWEPKIVAAATIALVIRIFPRLVEKSQEGREALAHPEEHRLTDEAFIEIVEAEIRAREVDRASQSVHS